MIKLLIGLLVVFVSSADAQQLDWHLPYCQNCEPKSAIEDTLPSHVKEIGELLNQGNAIEAAINLQFAKWGDFTRWIGNQKTKKPAPPEFKERWKNLEAEGEALIEVHRELGIAKRRLEVCRTKCSAYRRLELEDEVEQIEKMRLSLAAITPWWISEEFKELADKATEDDTFKVSSESLKSAFQSSMNIFFNDAFNIRSDIQTMKAKIDSSLKSKKSSLPYTSLISNFISHHGSTFDLLLHRSLVEGKKDLCSAASQKNNSDKLKHYAGKTLQYGLTTVSLLTGPEGLMVAVGLRTTLSWLTRVGLSTIRGPAVAASVALSGKLAYERHQLGVRCDLDMSTMKINGADDDSIKSWEQCLKQKEAVNIHLLLSSISSLTGPAFPKVVQLLRRLDKAPDMNNGIKLIEKADNKVLSVMDLRETRALMSKELDKSSYRYWQFVAEVYKKRLNLTDEEIKSFIESSKLYENRTHLIMQTSGAGPAAGKIEGGVGLVQSNKARDLLPLEKATGIKLPRDNGDIAEIVRLTATTEDSSTLMIELLGQISKVTQKNENLKTLYVFTSKIHERLYKKLGIPHKIVNRPNERDVIIEIDAHEFQIAMIKKMHPKE